MKWSVNDFKDGKVRIKFKYSLVNVHRLREICEAINPDRPGPAYKFEPCYYCVSGRWFEGGPHNLVGHEICTVEEIEWQSEKSKARDNG